MYMLREILLDRGYALAENRLALAAVIQNAFPYVEVYDMTYYIYVHIYMCVCVCVCVCVCIHIYIYIYVCYALAENWLALTAVIENAFPYVEVYR